MSLRTSSLILLLLATLSFARPARAGSLSVVYRFNQNSGTGDNAVSYISGPGTLLSGGGGTACTWCFAGQFELPGSTLSPAIYFLDFGYPMSGVFQGVPIDPTTFGNIDTTLSAGGFTFPSFVNGGTFTITVPAAMGTIKISQNGVSSGIFEVVPGELTLTFWACSGPNCSPLGSAYYFSNGQFTSGTLVTPEPQTVIIVR